MQATIKILTVLSITCLVVGLAASPALAKNRFYVGFGFGWGQAYNDEDEEIFDEAADTGLPMTFHLGMGGVVNPVLHVGFDLSSWYQDADYDTPLMKEDMQIQMTNWMLAVTLFPFTKGLGLKAGAGLATAWYDFMGDTGSSLGYSLLAGIACHIPIGAVFNLGLNLEYSVQFFEDADFIDRTSLVNAYLSFYWF